MEVYRHWWAVRIPFSLNRELERQDNSVNKRQVIGLVGRVHAARESPN